MDEEGGVSRPGEEKTVKNYTETETFKREFDRLKRMGASNDFLKKYTEIYMQFDENGMEIGTDYRLCVLAFEHPVK